MALPLTRTSGVEAENMAARGQHVRAFGAGALSLSGLWRMLRSMTFAIFMLLVILCIVIAGSFLPQDNGIRLVYQSWWFYGLNFVLMLSVVSCVARRAGSVYRSSFRVPVMHRPEFYRTGDTARELSTQVSVDLAADAVVLALRAGHYRVEVKRAGTDVYVLSDRFRAMRLGTLVSHACIVLMVATIAWGALAGWLDRSIQLEAGGAAVPIGHGTGLILRSDSFDFALYPDGTPKNFDDHLTIVENNGSGPVHQQMIDVNSPWYYGGMFGFDIHQADYGIGARLLAIDTSKGKPALLPYCLLQFSSMPDCSQPSQAMLLQPLGDGSYRPAGDTLAAFYLPDQDLAVTLSFHDAVPKQHLPDTAVVTVVRPPQRSGQSMSIVKEALDISVARHSFNGKEELVTDTPIDVGHLRIALLIRREAFVNVGHNPAVPFIFTSFALILLGLVSVLYFPFSRLWLYITPADDGRSEARIYVRGAAEKTRQGFKRRLGELMDRIQRELATVSSGMHSGRGEE